MEMNPRAEALRYFGNRLVTNLINVLFRGSVTDSQYGFRALRRDFIFKLSLRSNDWDIETEIIVRALKCRGKIVEAPSVELPRKHGKSHLSVIIYSAALARRIFLEILRP